MYKSINRDYIGLPEEYWCKQNFCWYMHDIILSILNNCIEDDKMNTTFTFDNEAQSKDFEKSEDKIDWLYENNYKEIANNILGKRIFHAISSDMCHFIYESLNTIEKGKITVSLALLRKPFRDSLLYLEWLLGDSKEFINMVNNQDIDKYAIENLPKDKKTNIIKAAIEKVNNKDFFAKISDTTYYDLRYNYKAENSLQRVWNKANHLVTTGNNIRSDEFNFVFLDEEVHLNFIDYYYRQVPHLLFYTYNIIIALYDKLVKPIEDTTKLYNDTLITYKFCDMMGTIRAEEYFNKDIAMLLKFICEDCEKIIDIKLNSEEFNAFRNGWSFTCPNCGNEINIRKYTFLEDYKDEKKHLHIIK